MERSMRRSPRRRQLLFATYTTAVAIACSVLAASLAAQPARSITIEGYVTAVDLPLRLEVNGRNVVLSEHTVYGMINGDPPGQIEQVKNLLHAGSFVSVTGTVEDYGIDAIDAYSVLVREPPKKGISGFGLVDKVETNGPEAMLQADGYRLHLTAATHLSFSGGLQSIAEVKPGMWVSYAGDRDKAGILVASKAEFYPRTNEKKKPAELEKDAAIPDSIPADAWLVNGDGSFVPRHSKVRLGDSSGWCGWHKLTQDAALQKRVKHVGMSVVPEYQKQLAADEAARIHFRFYVVDEPHIRSSFSCAPGMIQVPVDVVSMMRNDDQLAAVLADGVALQLQWQSARLMAPTMILAGVEIAGEVAGGFFPWVEAASGVGGGLAGHEFGQRLADQRSRMALAMVVDAGYDPWQAPEAWRELEARHVLQKFDVTNHPNHSKYQLEILNAQYVKRSAPEAVTSGR